MVQCSNMDNRITSANTAQIAKQNRTRAALLIVAIILLGAVLVIAYLKHRAASFTKPVSISEIGQKEFKLAIDNGRLTNGPTVITVKKGDKVHIQYSGRNMAEEGDVRLAGYGLTSNVGSNSTDDMEFTASKEGTFPIELRMEVEDEDESEATQTASTPAPVEEAPWVRISSVIVK